MKINKKTRDLLINILSIILMFLSILSFLLLVFYFQTNSPEYLTHEQFYTSISVVGFAFFAGLLSVWVKVSDKLTDFARELGEFKGMLKQYINNHPVKRKK